MQKQPRNPFSPLVFVRTLWLFSESDFATFVVPDTLFGISSALAGPVLTTNESPDLLAILLRLPQVLFYNWANLLIFDLANQRLPEAVEEDRLNKPWRPLPTGRITASQTRRLLLVLLPIVLTVNWLQGAWKETALISSLSWMYNDLKGGDEDFVVRNMIIGVGFGFYNGGSLSIACGPGQSITISGYRWVALISWVVFTTMHVQDMKDQVGDQVRGRRTIPLCFGDTAARWTIAIPMAVWSVVCPFYLGLEPLGYFVPCGLGFLIVARIVVLQGVDYDRNTWKLWALWICVLYMLPLLKSPQVRSLSWMSFATGGS